MKPLRVLGHSAHPPSVHVPMGLWLAVPAWDALALLTGQPLWWELGFWCLVGGLVGALPAVATGFWDYVFLPDSAVPTADKHWMLAVGAASVFGLSAALRGGGAPPAHAVWAVVSSLTGASLLSAAGWLGGELVHRHGAARVTDDSKA